MLQGGGVHTHVCQRSLTAGTCILLLSQEVHSGLFLFGNLSPSFPLALPKISEQRRRRGSLLLPLFYS